MVLSRERFVVFLAGLGPHTIMAMSSAYARMLTHVGKDMDIKIVIKALNSICNRAESCGELVVSG